MQGPNRLTHIQAKAFAAERLPRRQEGLGLLETLFLVLLIGGALMAAFTHLRSQAPRQQAEAQAASLAWADRALIGFATAHSRLPCPATQPDGAEDCGGTTGKGWLPVASLSLDAANPGPGTLPMGYAVYRGGSGSDLTSLTDQFNPHRWDGAFYSSYGALNGADLCVALEKANINPVDTAHAHFIGASGVVNVAYGIVAASPLGGSGSDLFDGMNVGTGVQLEAPTRSVSAGYGDRVRARGFDTLLAELNCAQVLASLDGMALAADTADEVASQKEALRIKAITLSTVNTVLAAVALLKVVLAAKAMYAAVKILGLASFTLTVAIASCVLLIGCAGIAPALAAMATAAASIVVAGVAIGLSATAMVLHSLASAETIAVAIAAGEPFGPGQGGSLADAVAAAHEAALEADKIANDARIEHEKSIVKRDAAKALYELRVVNLRNMLTRDYPDDVALNETRIQAIIDTLTVWFDTLDEQAAAKSNRLTAARRVDDLAEALVYVRNDYENKVRAWQNETDPAMKWQRELEMNVARDTLASIEEEQPIAANDLVVALQAERDANTAEDAADRARTNAIHALKRAYIVDFDLHSQVNRVEDGYKDYVGKRKQVDRNLEVRLAAETKAQEAWDGYYALLAIEQGGGPVDGSETLIGAGHKAILEEADARGAVQ